jgi:8-oxo-dGTP pyrophosphatase MutT (NUDIX family)
MLTFRHAQGWFTHRAAAVAIHDGRVLLHRSESDSFWVLPGGRVEFGESAADALARELREEIGVDARVVRLLWVVENFFQYGDAENHELGMYFLTSLPAQWSHLHDDTPFDGFEQGVRLIYQWFPLAHLPNVVLYPAFLCSALHALPDHTIHIVQRDGE